LRGLQSGGGGAIGLPQKSDLPSLKPNPNPQKSDFPLSRIDGQSLPWGRRFTCGI